MNTRMDRTRLNIGTYYLQPYARTEAHIRDLKDCGIDFVVWMDDDRPALDLFRKYGIGAVLYKVLPFWIGGDGENAGHMEETYPLEVYEKIVREFKDHPAVWALDTGDEPSAADFDFYHKFVPLVDQSLPNVFPFQCNYPNYASVAQNSAVETVNQLGTKTYEEFVDRYNALIGLDYYCYDFYMYSLRREGKPYFGMNRAYENLRVAADACRNTGRSLWIVLQVNSSFPEEWITENQLRFQAFSAMAFGVENIMWGCYTAGWWNNQVLDDKGEKTQQYDKLRRVNGEIRALAEDYMKYRRVSTHFIGFTGASALEDNSLTAIPELNTGVFTNVRGEGGADLIVGQFTARCGSGKQALFVCNAVDPLDRAPASCRVCFRTDGTAVRVLTADGEVTPDRAADGTLSFGLASSAGALIMAL